MLMEQDHIYVKNNSEINLRVSRKRWELHQIFLNKTLNFDLNILVFKLVI